MVTNLDWTSDDSRTRILLGDCLDRLRGLPSGSVHCCVTSPPYWWLRDYGVDGQMGLEQTPEEYTRRMVDVFAEVRRVLRDDGTCWLNLGIATLAAQVAAAMLATLFLGRKPERSRLALA